MMKIKIIKCKNHNCLMNENDKCGSPYRNREDFTCASMGIEKEITSEVLETKKQLNRDSWRETVGFTGFDGTDVRRKGSN